MNRTRLLKSGFLSIVCAAIAGVVVISFESPPILVQRLKNFSTYLQLPITLPLWLLALYSVAAIGAVPASRRLLRKRPFARIDGIDWVEIDDQSPLPRCPKCKYFATLVESVGSLRCTIKCANCGFSHISKLSRDETLRLVKTIILRKHGRRIDA